MQAPGEKTVCLTDYLSSSSFLGSLQMEHRVNCCLVCFGFFFYGSYSPFSTHTHEYVVWSSWNPSTGFSFREEFSLCNGPVLSSHGWSCSFICNWIGPVTWPKHRAFLHCDWCCSLPVTLNTSILCTGLTTSYRCDGWAIWTSSAFLRDSEAVLL